MTSMPASRSARAMIFAARSCPSRPGFATTTRIFLLPCCCEGSFSAGPFLARQSRRSAVPQTSTMPGTATMSAAPGVAGDPASLPVLERREAAGVRELQLVDARGAHEPRVVPRVAVHVDPHRLARAQHGARVEQVEVAL